MQFTTISLNKKYEFLNGSRFQPESFSQLFFVDDNLMSTMTTTMTTPTTMYDPSLVRDNSALFKPLELPNPLKWLLLVLASLPLSCPILHTHDANLGSFKVFRT